MNVGIVWMGKKSDDRTLDSLGNLETIPPYTYKGRTFPAGRIISGQRPTGPRDAPTKVLRDLLAAQKVQDPLVLDTSFLAVGHVDE
jgi:protein-arginine deiminase